MTLPDKEFVKCSHYIATDARMVNGTCKNGFPVTPPCYTGRKGYSRIHPFCLCDDFPKHLEWIGEMANDRARAIQ